MENEEREAASEPTGDANRIRPGSTLIDVNKARNNPNADSWYRLVQKIEERVQQRFRAKELPGSFTLDDLTAEVYRRTFRGLAKTDFENSKLFWGWIRTVADSAVKDMARRPKSGASLDSDVPIQDERSHGAAMAAEMTEFSDSLLECLDSIESAKTREILRLRLFESLSYSEIAEQLPGSRVVSLRTDFSRGRAKLQACLRTKGFDPSDDDGVDD